MLKATDQKSQNKPNLQRTLILSGDTMSANSCRDLSITEKSSVTRLYKCSSICGSFCWVQKRIVSITDRKNTASGTTFNRTDSAKWIMCCKPTSKHFSTTECFTCQSQVFTYREKGKKRISVSTILTWQCNDHLIY